MNRIKYFAAVSGAVMLLAASTFADDRHQNRSGGWRDGGGNDGRYENRDRGGRSLSAQGRITNMYREQGGYRLQLDRGSQWYFVPQSAWRGSRGRNFDLRLGVSVRLGGGYYDNRGYIHCADAWLDDDYGYDDRGDRYRDGLVAGTVVRIDYHRHVLELRDGRSGRVVIVDLHRAERRSRRSRGLDVADVRRGDYIEISGDWVRGGVFRADHIESIDTHRGRY